MLSYIHGREARPTSCGWILFKTLCQTAVFWFIFLFALPAGIVWMESWLCWDGWRFRDSACVWCGGFLFVLGGSLGLTSSWFMAVRGLGTPMPSDCARELVVTGPYCYIRNPMAIAGLTQGMAVGVILGSPAVVAYALIGGPIWHVFVRPWEEADLERRFRTPYRRYRTAVRCWLPRWTRYRSTAEGWTDSETA